MKRRTFLQNASLAVMASGLPLTSFTSRDSLDILVLGGTVFAGPAIVNSLRENHRVTLFNRGITNPDLFGMLPLIKGDRFEGRKAYEAITNKTWDIVVDVWPQKSALVDDATLALKNHARHYVFVSSIAVYGDYRTPGIKEDYPLLVPGTDSATWGYGEEKVVAEQLVRDRFPDNHTIVRPGPIKGWRDPATDLLYWLSRLNMNRDILGPGDGSDPLQFIDVRDVGHLIALLSTQGISGTFNCTGPVPGKMNWKEFLTTARTHLNSTSEIHYPTASFLAEHRVRAFDDLPLWVPVEEDPGFMQISNQKALSTGFYFSPLEETINDVLNWQKEGNLTVDSGLSYAREEEILRAWKRRNQG